VELRAPLDIQISSAGSSVFTLSCILPWGLLNDTWSVLWHLTASLLRQSVVLLHTQAGKQSHHRDIVPFVVQKLRVSRTASVEGHPYLRLLRAYLEEFLPRDGFEGSSPGPAAGDARACPAPTCAGLYGVGVVVWQYLSMMPDMQHQRAQGTGCSLVKSARLSVSLMSLTCPNSSQESGEVSSTPPQA